MSDAVLTTKRQKKNTCQNPNERLYCHFIASVVDFNALAVHVDFAIFVVKNLTRLRGERASTLLSCVALQENAGDRLTNTFLGLQAMSSDSMRMMLLSGMPSFFTAR